MKNIILIMIFVLLTVGAFFVVGINPLHRKMNEQEEKFGIVDEGGNRLTLSERIYTAIKNTVSMGGSNMKMFAVMIVISVAAGVFVGKLLFTDIFLALTTGLFHIMYCKF